ncbi:acetyl-CoA carboxylase, carboxyltransferase subunit beta [Lachnoclostridium sp. Marseille-P6806]|uniref:acetyl-CoA carboxylase, carboxyltransferase subunit beta n=1 Tax=Lachnoclostridium sp. Marseille-P6806 TaxID=2364793 RepID=UPI001030E077|nr:acetyl-CoA carboxylase, carboxyltransferase subunit beta [Lachnoclostridium sp. Marseille-P6806]
MKNVQKFVEKMRRAASSGYVSCKSCGRRASPEKWRENRNVCPYCGRYRPLTGQARFAMVFDQGSMQEFGQEILPSDPILFPDYSDRLNEAQKKTGLTESAITAVGTIGGIRAVAAVLDSRFLMGSMSSAVGERITQAVERAGRERLPLIIFSASGGARMQEGIFSLMQMAKTSAAIEEFSERGGFYISFLTHPTTGGVTASFASLGDITLAEPGALIGFAGPRVIEQTIGQRLPKDFQRAEYLEKHGFVDRIVERREMKQVLYQLLRLHAGAAGKGRTDA